MKLILGAAGGYLALVWALLTAVLIMKLPTVTFDGTRLALILFFAALPTAAAVALIRHTWRSHEGFAAAVLTSLVAATIVFVLTILVSLAGD